MSNPGIYKCIWESWKNRSVSYWIYPSYQAAAEGTETMKLLQKKQIKSETANISLIAIRCLGGQNTDVFSLTRTTL